MPTKLLLKLAACLAIVVALIAGWHKLTSHYYQQGYDAAMEIADAAAAKQEKRNQELQRAAEKSYVVTQGVRDRFIVQTVKEIRDAAAPLAACPVPDSVRVRLNAALSCARDDSGAACGAGEPVSHP